MAEGGQRSVEIEIVGRTLAGQELEEVVVGLGTVDSHLDPGGQLGDLERVGPRGRVEHRTEVQTAADVKSDKIGKVRESLAERTEGHEDKGIARSGHEAVEELNFQRAVQGRHRGHLNLVVSAGIDPGAGASRDLDEKRSRFGLREVLYFDDAGRISRAEQAIIDRGTVDCTGSAKGVGGTCYEGGFRGEDQRLTLH